MPSLYSHIANNGKEKVGALGQVFQILFGNFGLVLFRRELLKPHERYLRAAMALVEIAYASFRKRQPFGNGVKRESLF